jgi:hypothetical protein
MFQGMLYQVRAILHLKVPQIGPSAECSCDHSAIIGRFGFGFGLVR